MYANFYEKALFVKPTWRPRCPSATDSALRAMLLSALSVSLPFGGSVHRMRSVLIRALLRRCNLPSGLPWRVDQVRNLRSHLMLDPKRIRASGRALRLFRVLALADHHLLFSSYSAPSFFSLSRYTFAPVRVVERFVDLSTNP
jgi:hypothetical protein